MSFNLVSFVVEVVASLLAGAALLRAYLNFQRQPMNNPPGRLVFALTDWAVLPLRRVMPKGGRIDWASVILALAVLGVQYAITMLWMRSTLLLWALLVVFGAFELVVSLITLLMLVYALGSWFRMDPQIHGWLARACEPLLAPVRRLLPNMGGIDFSPMVVVLLVQSLGRALSHWQAQAIAGVLIG